jgi:hypothetical protein
MLARRDGRFAVEIDLALADQGVDVSIKGMTVEGLQQTEACLDFARDNNLARLSLDQGYGPESLWEPDAVTISLSGVPVPLPPGAFLQATLDGNRRWWARRWNGSRACRRWRICSPALALLLCSGQGRVKGSGRGSRSGGLFGVQIGGGAFGVDRPSFAPRSVPQSVDAR